jgi:hypothetical protein
LIFALHETREIRIYFVESAIAQEKEDLLSIRAHRNQFPVIRQDFG